MEEIWAHLLEKGMVSQVERGGCGEKFQMFLSYKLQQELSCVQCFFLRHINDTNHLLVILRGPYPEIILTVV